jgi:hypothetical protein
MSGHSQSITADPVAEMLGSIPYRLQLAGGWIDQPFVSQHNPNPPGSMVVVQIEPNFHPMNRSGIASSTRAIAEKLWDGKMPNRPLPELVRELYNAENQGKSEPSGSQDMIGLLYPGINRLDYDCAANGGVFPIHIESLNQPDVARWLESVLHLLPVEPRPKGYNPLGKKRLESHWVAQLGHSGQMCFDAIRMQNVKALGESLNLCMRAWEALLPQVVDHPLIGVDLKRLLRAYQQRYPGAMFSGCGGGYLMVASSEPVPGAFEVDIRIAGE